ncbi:solute carrier family 66 (lysosomal lysine-arginine transporter), member 1, partial [Tremellales sp. Uapishka_1]
MLAPLFANLNRIVIANALGYTSIACWLCAQFPQVLKNLSLKSCEGLALPFLVNWLFGDITNLIGCLLTDQLPFQTYLAAYFCVVDFCLLAQFIYYQASAPVTSARSSSRHVSHSYAASPRQAIIQDSNPASHFAHDPNPQLHRSTSQPSTNSGSTARPKQKRRYLTHYSTGSSSTNPDIAVTGPAEGSYQAIYEAALDVARAAEKARSRRSRSRLRRLSKQSGAAVDSMMESFHSDMSSATLDPIPATSPGVLNDRGRTLRRTVVGNLEGLPMEGGSGPVRQEMSENRSRSKSRSLSLAKRAAGVAFMSMGLLVGWGGWTATFSSPSHGVVLNSMTGSTSTPSWPVRHPIPFPIFPPTASSSFTTVIEPPHPPDDPPTVQRVIGRFSAWTCTTLYLTSRLPQIWMNFNRKSVEGLSILLFVFAFCGNLTYVASILLNPSGGADPSEAAHYLLEALPYLLGSGGTLIFDLTIMIQSLIYGSAPPIPSTPLDRSSRRRRRLKHYEEGTLGTERQALLSGSQYRERERERDRSRSISPEAALRATGTKAATHSRRVSAAGKPLSTRVEGLGVRLTGESPSRLD